jgi:orotidine-5'-phosphate decarboxylase
MSVEERPKLIVALDVETLQEAERLVKILYPTVQMFKIGSQLYTACGPQAVQMAGRAGAKVFLDLKFHDIPNTVGNAVLSCTSLSCVVDSLDPGFGKEIKKAVAYPVFMMTIHTVGGQEMMRFAVNAAAERAKELGIIRPKIVGVTVLTSDEQAENTQKKVVAMAISAKQAGLDGVVCSVQEAMAVRQTCGKDFIIVTPGIRPQGLDKGDQKRVATSKAAMEAGSDFLVVGRPIVAAADPLKAAQGFLLG